VLNLSDPKQPLSKTVKEEDIEFQPL